MLIDQNKVSGIFDILTKNGDDALVKEFRAIVAMARSRQQARNGIESQGIPILLHLIPFAILMNNNIEPPTGWKGELKAFFGNIDIYNSGKKKLWFSNEQIQEMLDNQLNPQVKKQILNKIGNFKNKPYYRLMVEGVTNFFTETKKLEDIGIKLKHIKDEEDLLSIVLFLKTQRIF